MQRFSPARLALSTIAAVGLMAVAACGGPSGSNDEVDTEGDVPSQSSEELEAAAIEEGKLVWYTSNTRPAADAIARAFEEKYEGITVEIFQAGGSQVIAKVEAEAMAGKINADFVDYSEGAAAVGQAERGLFQRYLPPNISDISEDLYDEDGFFFSPWYLTSTIVYNSDLISEEEAPKSWAELTDPKWQGKVGMASPDYAGTAVATVGTWQQEFGDEYIEDLGSNGLTVFEGFGNVHEAVLSGQTPVGVNLSFRALMAEREGQPMKWITPEEGQLLLSFAAAVTADAEHPNAAKLFANFLMTDELQEMVAANIGYFPGKTEIAAGAGMPDTTDMELIAADINELADPKFIADIKSLFKSATS